MKLILYLDIAVGKLSPEEYEALDLRAVKNFIEKNVKAMQALNGASIREALDDVAPEDFVVIDFEDKTLSMTAFFPNDYTYTLLTGEVL